MALYDPALERLTDEWVLTHATGVNPRTLSRLLSNGWIERKQTAYNKIYWRRAPGATDQEAAA